MQQEPKLSARKKQVADYMLAHECECITAYRATKSGSPSASDYANARAIKRDIEPYLEYHRARISRAMNTALSSNSDTLLTLDPVLQRALDRLRHSIVTRATLIAYWEDALFVGANEVLADMRSEKPKYSHLIESCEIKDDGSVKVKIPSKKDASAVLTVLKRLDQDGDENTSGFTAEDMDLIRTSRQLRAKLEANPTRNQLMPAA